MQEIDGALRVGGGLEDEPLVILQNGEPGSLCGECIYVARPSCVAFSRANSNLIDNISNVGMVDSA